MRFVALLLVFLGLSGWILTYWPHNTNRSAPETVWRHTAAGWEKIDRWPTHVVQTKSLSPLLVGSFQLAVSCLALMASGDAANRANRTLAGRLSH